MKIRDKIIAIRVIARIALLLGCLCLYYYSRDGLSSVFGECVISLLMVFGVVCGWDF